MNLRSNHLQVSNQKKRKTNKTLSQEDPGKIGLMTIETTKFISVELE